MLMFNDGLWLPRDYRELQSSYASIEQILQENPGALPAVHLAEFQSNSPKLKSKYGRRFWMSAAGLAVGVTTLYLDRYVQFSISHYTRQIPEWLLVAGSILGIIRNWRIYGAISDLESRVHPVMSHIDGPMPISDLEKRA